MVPSRYSINCKKCDDIRDVILDTDAGSYRCIECNSIYYEEDGVWDALDEAYYGNSRPRGTDIITDYDDYLDSLWSEPDWVRDSYE